jgi:hypothetical protein
MKCPARPIVIRKIGPFSIKVGQEHEWNIIIAWHLWWEITYTCEYCNMEERDIERTDSGLMSRFGFKTCPSHYGFAVYLDNSFDDYRKFPDKDI